MFDDRFILPEAAQILHQIEEKIVRGTSYSSGAYERDVTRLLNQLFPFSVLPGIRLFSSEPRGRVAYGFEMDNLLHVRFGEVDYIVIVEAKKQSITVDKGHWWVSYGDDRKCAREQVDNHIRTMWEYLKPIARNTELKFIAVVVSSAARTVAQKEDGYRNAELHLCAIGELSRLLEDRFNFAHGTDRPRPEVLRVPQSSFLDLLRLSLPVEQLGHPELASAIRYVDRCRRTLDEALFQRFDPKHGRWVINGSAGMGKSVLLAYSAAVLCSGHEIYRSLGAIGVKIASETFAAMGFDPDPKRGSVAIMAMSVKQLENLRGWFNLFVEQFQQGDTEGVVRFRPPEFLLCRSGMALGRLGRSWTALLVDEAHDLPPFAAREIADLYGRGNLYLVVACDRHQKLRLSGSDAKIVEGLDFTNRSTRLRHTYRNPAPVYIASLALMFRWFADAGPKVIPNLEEMRDQFGFETTVGADMALDVVMRSDAHPANSWCHTVAAFPDVATAFAALSKENMGHKEVLWVRFSEEDQDFDYEQLIQRFTYHNCRSRDAHKITDKYIKGRDYPIVVIEGFPGFMDRFEAGNGETAEVAEARMWAFRRELYLCASRATTFLYFVCNVAETPEVLRIRDEVQRLVRVTATPEDHFSSRGIKSWKFTIRRTTLTRSLDIFADTAPETSETQRKESVPNAMEPPVARPAPADLQVGALVRTQPVFASGASPVTSERQPNAVVELRSGDAGCPKLVSGPKATPVALEPSAPTSTASDQQPFDPRPVSDNMRQTVGTPSSETPSRPTSQDRISVTPAEQPKRVVVDLISGTDKRRPERQAIAVSPTSEVPPKSSAGNTFIQAVVSPNPSAPHPVERIVAGSLQPTLSPEPAGREPERRGMGSFQGPRVGSSLPKPRSVLHVPHGTTVRQLAEMLGEKTFTLVAELMNQKVFASSNHSLDSRSVVKLCSKRGFAVIFEKSGRSRPH